MIKVVKHGKYYQQEQKETEEHTYRCLCGCEFSATLKDFTYMTVGHGMNDYVGHCPECSATIYDMLDRLN